MARTEHVDDRPTRALRHVVLFRMYDQCTDAEVDEMVAELRTLGDLPGILSWSVELSLDERKGRVIVEDATFASQEDLEGFRRHPRHASAADVMAQRADWIIGNYWCELGDALAPIRTDASDRLVSP
jgi:hypothetical protein